MSHILHTEKQSEYYLLENRQQKGWDEFIPGHGMLVWHIDFVPDIWNLNIVNIEKQHIDIVEADNEQSEFSRSGDAFPGTAGVTELPTTPSPSMRSWAGTRCFSPITGIMEHNGVITFAFKGGERTSSATSSPGEPSGYAPRTSPRHGKRIPRQQDIS